MQHINFQFWLQFINTRTQFTLCFFISFSFLSYAQHITKIQRRQHAFHMFRFILSKIKKIVFKFHFYIDIFLYSAPHTKFANKRKRQTRVKAHQQSQHKKILLLFLWSCHGRELKKKSEITLFLDLYVSASERILREKWMLLSV